MSGYQDFAELFGNGIFISSEKIKKRHSLTKALSSLYILPTFFRGIYYIPTERERRGHFIERKQDYFTSMFDTRYGRKKWYWALSTAARHYGVEWSATRILEIVVTERSKTIDLTDKIHALRRKRSYRSSTLAKFLSSLDVNKVFIHKGEKGSLLSVKIDGTLGPVCTKKQLAEDASSFIPKVKDRNLKKIYKRIISNLKKEEGP
jgi:hypothetical protein